MSRLFPSLACAGLVACIVPVCATAQTASSPDADVPKGEVLQFSFEQSKIFPGTDRDGRLYVATNPGIQICDQAGRVNCIIPTPNKKITNLCFGGQNFDTLFATCVDSVYKRKVKTRGVHAWAAPHTPSAPGL